MAKSDKKKGDQPNDIDLVGRKIKTTTDLGNGFMRVTFEDKSAILILLVPMSMTVKTEDAPEPEEKKGKKAKKGKKEEPEEPEEESLTREEMEEALIKSGLKKKAVNKMSDDEIETAYNELDEPKDDDLSAADLNDSDFDDLEDIVDSRKLNINVEDYDSEKPKQVQKLREAIAAELEIKL